MTKLNKLLETKNVTALGFPAVQELSNFSKGTENVVLATLPAATLLEQGIESYYAPIIPRNSKFATAQDIINADLDVQKYNVRKVDKIEMVEYANPIDTIIVSRHVGTVDYIKNDLGFNGAKVFSGNVTADNVKGKHVVGTLPPHLVSECDVYTAISIKDFDYNKDGDLRDKELQDRIIVSETIKLKEERGGLK